MSGCRPLIAILIPAVSLLAGCARMEPPRGGPEDKEAPRIAAAEPDSASAGVARDTALKLIFTEPMDRSSVRDWLMITPWPGKMDCDWDSTCLTCVPLEGWEADQVYTVILGANARDRRKNGLEQAYQLNFTTGDSLPDGWIRGRVTTRAINAQGLFVLLYPWPALADSAALHGFRPDMREALRISQTDQAGAFELRYVPPGQPMLLGAIWDENGNRTFDSERDLWGFREQPAVCQAGGSDTTRAASDSTGAAGQYDFYLVFDDEPGDISGEVRDTLCADYTPPARLRAAGDSLARILSGELDAMGFAVGADSIPTAALTPEDAESLQVAVTRLRGEISAAVVDSGRCSGAIWVAAYAEGDSIAAAESRTNGSFSFGGLDPGLYRISAFRDLDGDGRLGRHEPRGGFLALIELLAGRKVAGVNFDLHIPTEIGEGSP